MTGKILIVDDKKELREIYSEFFINKGFEVDEAVDGQEGLEKLTNGNYDACIIDGTMPKMSGLDLLKQANFIPTYKIFNSGEPNLINQAKSEDLADVYFKKPTSLSKILAHVNYAIKLAEMELIAEEYF